MHVPLAILELLLFACPRDFRNAYRATIRADFLDIASEERAHHGFLGLARSVCGAYFDIVASGLRERAAMIGRDVAYAARSLRRTPLFTAVVITTLAVAIAANAAVFSILNGVLFTPLPYADPQSLVIINQTQANGQRFSFSYPNFVDLRKNNRVFSDVAATVRDSATMTGFGRPRLLHGQSVTASFFDVFGIRPQAGRFFSPADERMGSAHALVISDALFRSNFGGDSAILGTSIRLDGEAQRIVGVAPATFRAPTTGGNGDNDYWTVIRPSHKTGEDQRGSAYLSVFARRRPGSSVAAAQADVDSVMANLAQRYNDAPKHVRGFVMTIEEFVVGPARPLLFGVFAAVAAVLVVACANVANLLLSRAATRRRELAVRYALGATRARIIAQILTETLMLAAIGGVIGLTLAASAVREFVALRPPGIPSLGAITFDARVALFTFGVVLFCTLAAGLVPALTLSRFELADTLKAAGRGGDRSRGARARATFVVAEIAITLALVVASGLVVRSFIALTNTPLGFDPTDVTTVTIASLPNATYGNDAALIAFEQRAVARESALPGVTQVAWTVVTPFSGSIYRNGYDLPERPRPAGESRDARFNIVSPGYFGVLRIPMQRGRLFSDADRLGSLPVIIVNETFARQVYGSESPIGKRIKAHLSVDGASEQTWTIVGVAGNTRDRYAEKFEPEIYYPDAQIGFLNSGTLLVRTQPGVDRTALAAVIPALDPQLATPSAEPLTELVAQDAARARISAIALGLLALIALLLASAGIYAVVSYGVAQRTHEFGIRKALGARGSQVLADVLIRAARLAALGIAFGLILAAFSARLVAPQLFGIGTIDPPTYTVVVLVLFAATLVAALIPAVRAMRVDPIVALRYE